MGIKEQLHRLRKDAGYSLEEVANKAGTTKSYVWELENKPNIRPSAALVYNLSIIFDTSMEALIGRAESGEARAIMHHYDLLSERDRKIVLGVMKAMKATK